MKVKALMVTVILVAAFLLSCTTTTGTNGGSQLTQWAFDWAYDIAKSYAEDDNNWGDWDSGTILAFFDCVLADAKCMLGRPRENSFWEIFFQNDEAELYSVEVDQDGNEDGTELGVSEVDFDEVPIYSNSKLEEMMAFCIDDGNDFWDPLQTSADNYWWFVEVSSDYGGWFSGVDNIFRIWFYESQSDIDIGAYWGLIIIDCDGNGSDYEILYWEHYNAGAPYTEAPQSMPLSRMLIR